MSTEHDPDPLGIRGTARVPWPGTTKEDPLTAIFEEPDPVKRKSMIKELLAAFNAVREAFARRKS